MKKIAIVAGLATTLGALPAAHAQSSVEPSSVTLYGLMDAGLVQEGGVSKLTSGVSAGSRLGLRGTESLGNGLHAVFTLEAGVLSDTGRSDQAGQLFGRQAFVGIDSPLGMLTVGRQYNLQSQALTDVADPFEGGLAGAATNLAGYSATRIDNTVRYTSPELRGVTATVMYGAGEHTGMAADQRSLGLALGYVNGPLTLRLARQSRAGEPGKADVNNTILAGNYNFGVATAFAGYGRNTGDGSTMFFAENPYGAAQAPTQSSDSRDAIVGVSVPLGATTLLASYVRKDDRDAANRDAQQLAIGATYALSKRSKVYLAYAHIRNRNDAAYLVGNATEAGSGNRAFNIGMRHAF
ncbi:MAG: porin [Janthinobacterium sp.]